MRNKLKGKYSFNIRLINHLFLFSFFVADLIYENRKKPAQKKRMCQEIKIKASSTQGEKENVEKMTEGTDDVSETTVVKSRKVIA